MRTDSEIINSGFESIFSTLGIVDAERFIMLIKRDKFDYTEWQKKLWPDESVESLSIGTSAKGLGTVLIESLLSFPHSSSSAMIRTGVGINGI